MRVLVTGGAGYIGSHTAKQLARIGHEVVVLDNLETGHEWAVRWGPLIQGDIANPATVRAVLAEHQPDAVVHFAAHAYVGESMRFPEKYFSTNVAGTVGLLEAVVARRGPSVRLLVDLRNLRASRARADHRIGPASSGEPVRRVEAHDREGAALAR